MLPGRENGRSSQTSPGLSPGLEGCNLTDTAVTRRGPAGGEQVRCGRPGLLMSNRFPGAKRHRGVDRVSLAKPHAISHDVLAAGALPGARSTRQRYK
jgi:hypothetical protein